jgi:hypothetical protein
MIIPVTKRMEDNSTVHGYQFTFFCDTCGKPWRSGSIPAGCSGQDPENRQKDHDAAYERANQEAIRNHNRCKVCGKWVCDDCFLILPSGDLCPDCAGRDIPKTVITGNYLFALFAFAGLSLLLLRGFFYMRGKTRDREVMER